MIESLIIRPEEKADHYQTELMTMRSFWNKFGPGCSEHLMVRVIRESKDYLPEISRVAVLDGKVVGAIYYTKARIVDGDTGHDIATFGPLAVEPMLEGNDIGGALVRETIKLAMNAGISGIAILGEPYYYPRFGFRRGAEFGITDAFGNTSDALMVLPLNNDFSTIKGKLIESDAFEKLGDADLLREISKDFPAYRKVKVQEGFMQIFNQHLGVVESVVDGQYMVRYWEDLIPAALSDSLDTAPIAGDDVLFKWDHRGIPHITKVFRNLLE